MPSKRRSKKDKEQFERFIEAARQLGCDESEEAFERVFKKIVPPRLPLGDKDEKDESRR